MPQPLISIVTKTPLPIATLGWEGAIPIVVGNASVPVELRITGAVQEAAVGVDIVFLIDNSGSMAGSDPDKQRFSAILTLIDAFAPTRDALDRIAIVTFQGSQATVIDPGAPWKTWSGTAASIAVLMHPEVEGTTPIADAMRKANALLMASNGFYRLAILISDGLPVPDDETYPQTLIIVNNIIPNECVPNRILYSTIYLYTQPPEDNALLIHIAKETDYITPYLPGNPPAYYFKITSPNEIVAKYRDLFEKIETRLVPQDVRISERINSRLIVDPDAPVTFSGNGFAEDRNLLGGTPLSALIEQFRRARRLDVHLNELNGEVIFRFAVKLDLGSVTDAEYASRYFYADVDVPPESLITWLQPNTTAGSTTCTLVLPQARVKFLFGISVIKELDAKGMTARIYASNIDSRPVKEFQLAEFPSSYANVATMGDDFDFHPFRMLYEKCVLPWFLKRVPVEGLSQQAKQTLLNKVKEVLRVSHKPVLDREAELDRYLCQFGFYESKPGSEIYDPFWNTPSQRGIYKALLELPPKTSRCLTFDINGTSYLLSNGPDQMLSTPADALEPKGLLPMSEYTAQGLGDWKAVLQNPAIYQIVSSAPEADLFLRTCFSADHVHELMPLFLGENLPNGWAMLDSADMTLIWQPGSSGSRIGLSVTIYNGGDAPSAPTQLRARSLYLPFTGEEFSQPRRSYQASPPFFGSAEAGVASIQGHLRWSMDVVFRSLYYVKAAKPLEKVDPVFLQKVQDAIVITTVDVVPATNERVQSNNSAIEIVPLRGG